ncbi:MAG: XRE family transcriptional regulator [Alphaproteobacteria bacterium]|nr:XRE family transcriptional regulator [Alphaproteobacteria bacterium]
MSKSYTKAINTDVSKLLKSERKAKDMTQHDIASKLMKPQSFVAKYENGEKKLTIGEFVLVCKSMGLDPSWIIRKISKP